MWIIENICDCSNRYPCCHAKLETMKDSTQERWNNSLDKKQNPNVSFTCIYFLLGIRIYKPEESAGKHKKKKKRFNLKKKKKEKDWQMSQYNIWTVAKNAVSSSLSQLETWKWNSVYVRAWGKADSKTHRDLLLLIPFCE